jgi:hypothetical protein
MFNNIGLDYIYNKQSLLANLYPNTGLLLIGHASRGPALVIIDSKGDVNYVRRVFGEQSSLTRSYIEATQNGATNIYLARINGTHHEIYSNGILFKSIEATDEASNISITTVNNELIVSNPVTNVLKRYTIDANLISNINLDASNFESEVYATACAQPPATLSTGATQFDLSIINNRFEFILEQAEPYPLKQIGVLCGSFNHEENNITLYSIVSDFIERKLLASEPCMITMGIVPEVEASSMVISQTYNLTPYTSDGGYKYPFLYAQLSTNPDLEIENFPLKQINTDKSMYINVIVSRVLYDNGYESYASPCIGIYCGLLSKSSYMDSTINKTIPNILDDLTDYISDYTAAELTDFYQIRDIKRDRMKIFRDFGYIVINYDYYRGQKLAQVLDGITHVYNTSAITGRLINVLLIQDLIYSISNVLNTFNEMSYADLRNRITNVIKLFGNVIVNYTVDIAPTIENYTKIYNINIVLEILGEIETISVSLKWRG